MQVTEIPVSVEGYGLVIHRAGPNGLVETSERYGTYGGALARSQTLEGQFPRGAVQVKVYRLEANARYPEGIRWAWLETRGGIR